MNTKARARFDAQDSDMAQRQQTISYGVEAATEHGQDVVIVHMRAGGYVWLLAREYDGFMPGPAIATIRPGPMLSDARIWMIGGWRGGAQSGTFHTNDGRNWRWNASHELWVSYTIDMA